METYYKTEPSVNHLRCHAVSVEPAQCCLLVHAGGLAARRINVEHLFLKLRSCHGEVIAALLLSGRF